CLLSTSLTLTLLVLCLHVYETSDAYPLALLDALPIWGEPQAGRDRAPSRPRRIGGAERSDGAPPMSMPCRRSAPPILRGRDGARSEEHTSELQSRENLVCRLLLEKKKR